MKPSIILTRALAKIKKGWCQGGFAFDKKGELIESSDKKDYKNAVKFCTLGAVNATAKDWVEVEAANLILMIILGLSCDESLWRWNDKPWRTKKQVVSLFKKAIKKAREEEK